jgi:hypothetical protein
MKPAPIVEEIVEEINLPEINQVPKKQSKSLLLRPFTFLGQKIVDAWRRLWGNKTNHQSTESAASQESLIPLVSSALVVLSTRSSALQRQSANQYDELPNDLTESQDGSMRHKVEYASLPEVEEEKQLAPKV